MTKNKNSYLSSKYLTHKHASFYGCTLEEMGFILSFYAAIEIPLILLLSIITHRYLGGVIGALLLWFLFFTMLTSFYLLKKTAISIGKMRNGRAPGYITLWFKKIMKERLGIKIPYVSREGYWMTKRSEISHDF